ncbi:MAG: peptide deformylase [Caulobacter sp.]|nr:peptide deformylase [Caulobacter sp.]
MTVRRILTVDNAADLAVLKRVSTPVEGGVTDEHRALMDDMLETMYAAPGIGLAAVQVGVDQRIIVMDLGDRDVAPLSVNDDTAEGEAEIAQRNPRYFVNPEITWKSEELFTYEEGCLSVPEIFDAVERPARVKLRYLDYQGQPVEEEASGMYAVCIQHEMDHLEGVLFIDHLSRLKRDRAISKVKKAARAA